jgi:hypothetical protein
MTLEKTGCYLAGTLLLAAMMAPGAIAAPCPDPPFPPQSPRIVNPDPWPGVYNGKPPFRPASVITDIKPPAGDQITYQGKRLYLCDQHYHVPVENPQGPQDERVILPGEQPQLGQWIEVHTVYAASATAEDAKKCRNELGLDNGLKCCERAGPPIVVRGFSAKVTATAGNVQGGGKEPLISPVGAPLAEWSGSNTGPDNPPGSCKPVAAQWSFLLNRDLTVGKQQLSVFPPKPHGARDVQSDDRLSKDLTLAAALPPPYKDANCRWAPTSQIWNQQEAVRECPKVCKSPSPHWDGRWFTVAGSTCSCCR